ncbi:MAG TPA: hypothetical protein VK919_04395 [Solirubrobacterales bacterium]|nr:hypothetical protein [Solirubrobacterales bacterium]
MAQDEWRIEVDLDDPEHGFPLSERLRAVDLDDEVASRLGERVIVTRDGPRLYVYAQSDEAAREAESVVGRIVADDELTARIRRERWNPVERTWQDADEPAPEGGVEEVDPSDDEGVDYPLFVYIEGHQPRFVRDLGL